MFKNVILLLVLAMISTLTNAQKPDLRFKPITDINGLSHSSVKTIVQDYQGYMWFGTMDGLNKYDGNKIKVYKNRPNDSSTLVGSEIYDILEDYDKNLWIGTRNGLSLYLRDKDSFRFQKEVGNIKITDLYEDRAHDLWFGSGHSIYKYDKQRKIFVNRKENIPTDHIKFLFEDSEGTFWVGSYQQLFIYDKKGDKLKPQEQFTGNDIRSVFEDSRKNLWMTTDGQGLILYDRSTKSIKKFLHIAGNDNSLLSNAIMSISEDGNGNLWLGCQNGGLSIFDFTNNKFYNYSNDPGDPESLSFNTIDCSFKDRNKDMWLGTFSGGVNFVKERKFALYRNNVFKKGSLSNNNVLCMLEDSKENIWIGTDGGGLNLMNKNEGTFTVYQHDPNNPKSLSTNAITSITEDKQGNVWIGHWAGGLDRFDSDKKEFINFKHQKDFPGRSWANECIMSLYEDKKSNLWVSTLYQLNRFDRSTGNFISYSLTGGGLDNFTCDILEDSDSNLWIGTWMGLHLLNPETKERIRYVHNKEDSTSLSNDKIYTLFEDSKKRLWIGTSDGLNFFNKKEKKFTIFRTDDGLPSNAIYAILEDQKGNFWLSTGNGICMFNPDTKETKTYTVSDGLQGNEFKQHAFLKLKSGEMLFGGAKGFNMFHPDKMKENSNVPPVVLTDFKIFNKSVPIEVVGNAFRKHISQSKTLTLSHKESVFSFEFAALNYVAPEKNQYAFIMEPFEKDWNYVGNVNNATYTNLDPGTYTFRVKASNNDGVWNEEGTSLTVIVTPPFWKTLWFKSLLAFVLIAGVFTVYKVRVNIIEQQKKYLEAEVDKRTHELSEANTELHRQKEVLSEQAEEMAQQADNLNSAYNEIKRQGEKLETVFNDTKENIRAAQVIQNSILPSLSSIKNFIPEIFILNRPKDVVSGDFYWFQAKDDSIVIAAVDCTGHGVSGAFMSIIGHNLLNQVANSASTLVASEILDKLNEAVIRELHQDEIDRDFNEGMDIALCILNKDKTRLQYAGANSPMYIARNADLIQVKQDRFSIGRSITGKVMSFTNHQIHLQKGDMIYLFSDGYADQTGGEKGSKFMYPRFRELLVNISREEIHNQEEILDTALRSWRGEIEQLDDVLVIGFRA